MFFTDNISKTTYLNIIHDCPPTCNIIIVTTVTITVIIRNTQKLNLSNTCVSSSGEYNITSTLFRFSFVPEPLFHDECLPVTISSELSVILTSFMLETTFLGNFSCSQGRLKFPWFKRVMLNNCDNWTNSTARKYENRKLKKSNSTQPSKYMYIHFFLFNCPWLDNTCLYLTSRRTIFY